MRLCTPCKVVAEATVTAMASIIQFCLECLMPNKQQALSICPVQKTGSRTPDTQGNPCWAIIVTQLGNHSYTAIEHLQLIQRRCEKCNGSGLVERGPFLRKCPECGGFFPWQGWKQFLTSTAAPGNGGVLRQPRNQEGVIYRYHASLLQ